MSVGIKYEEISKGSASISSITKGTASATTVTISGLTSGKTYVLALVIYFPDNKSTTITVTSGGTISNQNLLYSAEYVTSSHSGRYYKTYMLVIAATSTSVTIKSSYTNSKIYSYTYVHPV